MEQAIMLMELSFKDCVNLLAFRNSISLAVTLAYRVLKSDV